MKILEVLNSNTMQWHRLVEAKEGHSLVKKGDLVTHKWTAPDGDKVISTYDVSKFPAYSIV